jgi:hypothetical protein
VASSKYRPPGPGPLSIEQVIELAPKVRQSLLSKHDDCPLSSYIEMRYSNGWSTHPQARGTIFHLFAAKFLRELQARESHTLPVSVAEAILVEACRQETDSLGQPIPPTEIVRVPVRQMGELRMAARKFAKDNKFRIERIVDVEQRMEAMIEYPDPRGGVVRRTLTGQVDALLFDPDTGGAVVLDWKDTWGRPPERRAVEGADLPSHDQQLQQISYEGYFQQRMYGWLVLKCFPQIPHVTLREFYVRFTEVREATLTREWLPHVEDELSILIQQFDAAMMQGAPKFPYGWFDLEEPYTVVDDDGEERLVTRELDIARMGHWKPQPGKHCGFCARTRDCPIDADTRIEAGAPPMSTEHAEALAGEMVKSKETYDRIRGALKAHVDTTGKPVKVLNAKGRMAIGWVKNATGKGRTFKLHVPDDSDRGGDPDLDSKLAEAMRSATGRAKRERQAPGGRA